MNTEQIADNLYDSIQPLLFTSNFATISELIAQAPSSAITDLLERLPARQQAVVYRLLPKDRSITIFEMLSPRQQSDLIASLQDSEVAAIFTDLDPDDRAWLLDELPASVAPRLLQGLASKERALTADVLGYPKGSVGRRMSPEYVSTRESYTVAETLTRLRERLDDAETIYTLPVLDDARMVVGIVSLRDLLKADETQLVSHIMQHPIVTTAYDTAEDAARKVADERLLALPIVDRESRLVGILTVDDAMRIVEHEETEDTARQGGVEPLRRPYFTTPLRSLVSSRLVWLLVLAIGATLTVKVLSVFEDTLEQVTVLALFVPLLIGTGGNTGNQAATTVTRALALGDVRTRDAGKVLLREFAVGLSLGSFLGIVGGLITGSIYEPKIGLVIGLTLGAVCTMAASIGGIMPLIARALGVDPAVFSNPFITTFVDASGLIVYFLIAQAVLGI